MLRAADAAEPDLECGPADPRDPVAAGIYRDAGGRPERVRHNCSGKHAFAIALARAEGWPVAGYVAADHPVQQTMWVGLAEATGLEPADLPHADRRLRDADVLGAAGTAGGRVRPARGRRPRAGGRSAGDAR